jgi:Cu-processing system permease protein
MRSVARIVRYETRDVVRSRWLLAYLLFFLLTTDALLRFGGTDAKAAVSLTSVVLFVIPLVALVYGTMYLHDAREFTILLLTQPIGRLRVFSGLYLGLALPLTAAFLAGAGVPLALHAGDGSLSGATLATLLGVGTALTWVFLALALLVSVHTEDRVRGLGLAIALWLAGTVLYDGAVMIAASLAADYPLERPLLALTLANPVDLGRVLLLLRLDFGALMGYTGAVFERFFGTARGSAVSAAALAAWIALPLAVAARRFRRRDF